MSKVEETIKKIEEALTREYDTPSPIYEYKTFLKHLREIQAEQEELQKKADAYDKFLYLATVTNTPIDEIEAAVKVFVSKGIKLSDWEKLQEASKPAEVPEDVAKWISKYKKHGYTLYQALSYIPQDAKKWYLENAALCESAWVNGYTVKQQLYYVDFMSGDIHKRLIRDPENGVFDIVEWSRNLIGVIDEMFTESEIKAIDERYLPFAVKVEEQE